MKPNNSKKKPFVAKKTQPIFVSEKVLNNSFIVNWCLVNKSSLRGARLFYLYQLMFFILRFS